MTARFQCNRGSQPPPKSDRPQKLNSPGPSIHAAHHGAQNGSSTHAEALRFSTSQALKQSTPLLVQDAHRPIPIELGQHEGVFAAPRDEAPPTAHSCSCQSPHPQSSRFPTELPSPQANCASPAKFQSFCPRRKPPSPSPAYPPPPQPPSATEVCADREGRPSQTQRTPVGGTHHRPILNPQAL